MSIELQIESSALGSIIARSVQARLWNSCYRPLAGGYIDHADVSSSAPVFVSANNAVRVRVAIDVFYVRSSDVTAAPNASPAGTGAPVGTVFVVLEMAAAGAVVSLQCVDVDLGSLAGPLGPDAPAVKATICQTVGAKMELNLTAQLKRLAMENPGSSRVDLVNNIVAIRFEPAGNGVNRLFPGQQWGMFLDGGSVEKLAVSKVPADLSKHITSLSISPHWRPAGDVPHVDIDYSGKAPQVPNPFAGDIDGTLACDFSLTPTITKLLRTTVHWSLHINLGDFVPGFIDNMVEDVVEKFMDPTKFGGTPVGDHAFTMDNPLPGISFGGSQFEYVDLHASPDGMTIGGRVILPVDAGTLTVKPLVTNFGLPYRIEFCRELAKSGSGAPSKTASPDQVNTNGRVWLENFGRLCGIEIVSPGNWISPYISYQADKPEIRIVIPSAVALGITSSVRIIVRTARGVRLIDLGTPPPVTVDANGNVTNAVLNYIDNCLYLEVEKGIDWIFEYGINEDTLNPPLEHPDWASYLDDLRGIDVQLVRLSELEPGELIQFNSRDHAVTVTADVNGNAIVPVLLPINDGIGRASLSRVNRRAIDGHFSADSAIFLNQFGLMAGQLNRLSLASNGIATITTEFEDHMDVHEIGDLGAPILLRREDLQDRIQSSSLAMEVKKSSAHDPYPAVNPQAITFDQTQIEKHGTFHKRMAQLPGIASIIAVPGFANVPLVLAKMEDGSVLILDLSDGESVRVAGTFAGPIGSLDEAGDWAMTENLDRVSVFRVIHDRSG